MPSNRFYLACLRDTVGTNMSFHCHNGGGYHTDLRRAHVYTREEAQRAWNRGRSIDLPVCADRVDALAVFHVDHQALPTETLVEPSCNLYVAFRPGRWNGNDVYWRYQDGVTLDFTKAALFDAPSEGPEWIWVPWALADQRKRPTFDINLLDRRRMVQGAGMITPDHIRRERRRGGSGKTRFNCPGCGRVHWQYNPYDFEGCRNTACDHWRI